MTAAEGAVVAAQHAQSQTLRADLFRELVTSSVQVIVADANGGRSSVVVVDASMNKATAISLAAYRTAGMTRKTVNGMGVTEFRFQGAQNTETQEKRDRAGIGILRPTFCRADYCEGRRSNPKVPASEGTIEKMHLPTMNQSDTASVDLRTSAFERSSYFIPSSLDEPPSTTSIASVRYLDRVSTGYAT